MRTMESRIRPVSHSPPKPESLRLERESLEPPETETATERRRERRARAMKRMK